MGYGPFFDWNPRNIAVQAGETKEIQAFNEFYYLIHIESPLLVDLSMQFTVESDISDTDQDDFFVNSLPFNCKELSGNISLKNNNSADPVTFIFIHVNPE